MHGMTAPRLGYVVRFVRSLDAAVDFYERVLGQRLTKRTEHWAQFACEGITFGLYDRAAMAANLGVDEAQLGAPPGAVELAFEAEDVDVAYAAAVKAGARSFREPADRPWGERTAYLMDPDGALVELYMHLARDGQAQAEEVEIEHGADQGEEARRQEMATPSSEGHTHGDPND